MKTKTGMVMEIKGNVTYIMTQNGEFEKVKIKSYQPSIGEIYTGEVYKKHKNIKYFVSAASVFLCVALAGTSYAYYNPVNSLIVKFDNIDTKIHINKFNKIIKVAHTSQECNNIVESLKLKNRDINDGLTQIIDVSKGTNNNNNLLVEIKANNKVKNKLDIEKFKENMKEKNIDYSIDKKTEIKSENNLKNKTKEIKINKEKETKDDKTIKNSNISSNKIDKTIQNNKENQNPNNILNDVKKDEDNKQKNDKSDTKNKMIIEINNDSVENKNKKEYKKEGKENKNNNKKTK
jgi:hypothetical protein